MFKKTLGLLVVLVLVFVLRVEKAQATTYYVDSISGSDSNSGASDTTPWQTLDAVRAKTLLAGDSVLFKAGGSWDTGFQGGSLSTNLGFLIDESGTSSAPITFGRYGTGSAPVFINTYTSIPYTRVVTITGDYITLKDVVVKDAKEAGIYLENQSSFVTIDNVDVSNVAIGIVLGGTNASVQNSRIHDTVMFTNTNDNGDNDSGATAVMITGSNNTVTKNAIENNLKPSFDYGTDGTAVEFYSDGGTVTGNTVTYNSIKNNDTVTEIGGSGTPTFSNASFAFNVMENNSRLAVLHLSNGNFGSAISAFSFYHNTIYENTAEWQGVAATRPAGSLIWFASTPNVSTLSLRNNIFSQSGFSQFASHDTFSHDYNLYHVSSGTSLYGLGLNEKTGDPLFVSTSGARDYSLQLGSPAIDTGVTTPLTPDFVGTTVPQGSSADMGAYEALAISPTPSPTPIATVSPTPVGCAATADINQDTKVNLVDYSLLSAKFFQTTHIAAEDLNCDGKVNLMDFSLLVQEISLL